MLSELSIKAFLEKTASGSPVPGGGSIAALGAAVAAALLEMVANLTAGKKGFEAVDLEMRELAEEAARFREKLIRDIDRDSEAYEVVLSAYRLPGDIEGRKEERTRAVQAALKNAALVPLEVARDACRIMELAGKAVKKGNPNAVTDAAVGIMMARTAALSALYNVKINLASITDEVFFRETTEEVRDMEQDLVRKERRLLSVIDL